VDNDPHQQLFGIDQSADFVTLHLLAGVVAHSPVFALNYIFLNADMPFNPQPTAP